MSSPIIGIFFVPLLDTTTRKWNSKKCKQCNQSLLKTQYWNITVFKNRMNQEVFIYWKMDSSVIHKVIRSFKLCDDILNKVLTISLSPIQLLLFAISIAFMLHMWIYGFVASKYCMNVVYISQYLISVWILGSQHSRKD